MKFRYWVRNIVISSMSDQRHPLESLGEFQSVVLVESSENYLAVGAEQLDCPDQGCLEFKVAASISGFRLMWVAM